jgi:hypothetical protein
LNDGVERGEMTDWQTIDRAPTDGTTILGRMEAVRFLCAWYVDEDDDIAVWCIKLSSDPDDWAVDVDGDMLGVEPDAWMPVP